MPALPAINNLRTVLSLPLSAVDTVATVAFTVGFPDVGIFSVEDEILAYTGRTPTTFTGLTRGYDGSIATTHVAGLTCSLRIIAKHLNDAAFINPLPTTVDVGGIPAGTTFPDRVTVQELIDRLLYPSDDTYPTHDAVRGRGGLTHALTTVDRDAISVYRRRAGMLCYVDADGIVYQLQADMTTWEPFISSASGGTTYLASFGDATPATIMDLPDSLALDQISVNVTEEWDGVGASIEIGVVGETDRFFSALDTELTSIATFSKDFLEVGPKQITLTINPGVSPTSGKVHIQISTTPVGT